MKSKREEDEIFRVAPHFSERWLVYDFASRFTPENDSSHKGWSSSGDSTECFDGTDNAVKPNPGYSRTDREEIRCPTYQ